MARRFSEIGLALSNIIEVKEDEDMRLSWYDECIMEEERQREELLKKEEINTSSPKLSSNDETDSGRGSLSSPFQKKPLNMVEYKEKMKKFKKTGTRIIKS